MQNQRIKNIVIVGGGTAGWMTAAGLAFFQQKGQYNITLIESDQIGTVGVGEATVPHLRYFNEKLGINENEFMQKTNATYKLGIEFCNWGKLGDAYIHPFGAYGETINDVPFHHYWLKQRKSGDNSPIGDYSVGVCAAKKEKFAYPQQDPNALLSTYSYAFHLDATLYANYLRDYCEKLGVNRIEGKVTQVDNNNLNNFITAVTLESGEKIEGDLFIDCSGFRGLLIEQNLQTGFEDWQHWLPCDRAVAVPSKSTTSPTPYSRASAQKAGWQWRIPLQHRVGNGHVYSSKFMDDEEAAKILLDNLDSEPLANLNFLRFKTGRRKKTWNKNCIAIGLSSGFLEPLESTSIYLIQLAIMKLIEYFPQNDFNEAITDEFNREMTLEYERIRDFLILHYNATQRDDSDFWNYCRTMSLPSSLEEKIELYKQQGHVVAYKTGFFLPPSWVAVYTGQNILPDNYHPRADALDGSTLKQKLSTLKNKIDIETTALPSHEESLKKYCSANANSAEAWPKAAMSLYGVLS